jgi:predicted translin family RNA/ssDNA-binding protein
MERGEELMELNRAAFDRNTVAFERVMAALDRHEQMFEEHKLFIREMTRRSDKVVQDLIRGNREFSAAQAKRTDEITAELRDGRAERKAHTDALLALVDRLPPPAQAA